MDADELVRLAMEAAGIAPDDPAAASKLARALHYDAYNSPQRVRRWLSGVAKPDYDATLALLRLAGLLPSGGSAVRKTRA